MTDSLSLSPCLSQILPAHERIVERVGVRRDEAAAPVDSAAHRSDVPLGQRREKLEPVGRIFKSGDLVLGDAGEAHDLPLGRAGALFRRGFGLLAGEFRRVLFGGGRGGGGVGGSGGSGALFSPRLLLFPGEHRRAPKVLHLLREPVCASLDRHASAVEGLREKDLVAAEPAVGGGKLEF